MANGKDEIIPSFDPKAGFKQFQLTKEWQKSVRNFRELPPVEDKPGLKEALREAFDYILEKRKEDIEYRFGKGSADWLSNNREALTGTDMLQFHDVFSNLPKRPLKAVTPTPNFPAPTFKSPNSALTGTQG